jgi:hypothetical protein
MFLLCPQRLSSWCCFWRLRSSISGACTRIDLGTVYASHWGVSVRITYLLTPPDTLLNTSLVEVIGYAAREASHDETGKLMPYVIQDIFILIAPACFAASIYMTLGRVIRSVNAKHLSPIRTSRLTKTFVGGDLLSFSIQGVAANFFFIPKLAKVGQGIVVVRLFVQLLMFGLFIATTIVFHLRLLRRGTSESYASKAWGRSLLLLYSVSTLIMIRSLFRIVEYIMGQDGYLLGHEWTLYIFDSVPMFLVTVLFYFQEPVNIDPGTDGEELRLDARSKPRVNHLLEERGSLKSEGA